MTHLVPNKKVGKYVRKISFLAVYLADFKRIYDDLAGKDKTVLVWKKSLLVGHHHVSFLNAEAVDAVVEFVANRIRIILTDVKTKRFKKRGYSAHQVNGLSGFLNESRHQGLSITFFSLVFQYPQGAHFRNLAVFANTSKGKEFGIYT